LQDTLWDCQGRHYFNSCTIEGAMDFIYGAGQSLYEVIILLWSSFLSSIVIYLHFIKHFFFTDLKLQFKS